MLKQYLQHQFQRAIRGEINNALYNCHVVGLKSIMLNDEPGNRIRMFYADKGALFYNDASIGGYRDLMKLGVHNHHSDIQLIGIFGDVYNSRFQVIEDKDGRFSRVKYTSKILTGKGSIEDTGVRGELFMTAREPLSANPFLRATELHTVSMDSLNDAAWLVIEGAANPNYEPVCWTNNTKVDFDSLYLELPKIAIVKTIERALDALP